MARKAVPSNTQVTANAQDIGYVLGKMEMLEKKFDEHRIETKSEQAEIIDKLDSLSKNMSFLRYTLWLFKATVASVPLLIAANYTELTQLWKDM